MSRSKSRFSPTGSIGIRAVQWTFLEEFSWIPHSLGECDQGIDLLVEVCVNGEPTGRFLAVQVKAGESYFTEGTNDKVIFKFSNDHYNYWINYRLPVLIILHNPSNGKTIWERITRQTCVRTKRQWKVQIPLNQELTAGELSKLRDIAQRRLLVDAVKQEEERMKNLDSRFDPKVRASAKGTCIILNPTEEVPLRVTIAGEEKAMAEKWENLIERGKPVSFAKHEIAISGSPLFEQEEWNTNAPIELQIAKKKDVSISLVAIDDEHKEQGRIDGIPAKLVAGRSKFEVTGSLHESPLGVEIEGDFNLTHGKFSMCFAPEAWFGNHLGTLSYFNQIQNLISGIVESGGLRVECYRLGNRLFSASTFKYGSRLRDQARFVSMISKARYVANELGLNPCLPSEFSYEHMAQVNNLYALLKEGEVTTNVSGLRIDTKLNPTAELINIPAVNKSSKASKIELRTDTAQSMPFLDLEVAVGPLIYVINSGRIGNLSDAKKELQASPPATAVDIQILGCKDCRLTRKLIRRGD